MADNNEEGKETTTRGNEWEVVSLTASAYAAAPGPEQIELNDNDKGNAPEEDEAETSRGIDDNVPELGADEGGRSDTKDEENWSIKGLAVPDEFPGIQFFDEKDNRLSIHGTKFDEGTTLQGLDFIENEQSLHSASKFSSFHSETTMGGSTTYFDDTVIPGQIEPSEGDLDSDISQLPKPEKEDEYDSSALPCEAWWKRRAASLYAHAKETNAFWSIFIAAAVMGLVIIGQRWQQERWQVLQLKWQFNISDEKMGRMLGPISRFKDVIVGGSRRGSSIRGTSSTQR
ncbi:hypothetical protein ACSBR2_016648 [Camellia fascicularis]